MALYRIQVFKQIGTGKEWSNTYWAEATDLDQAIAFGAAVVGAEISIHKANVNFIRYRVSTKTPGDNVYATTPINQPGNRVIASGQYPLFNTARVDFAVFGGRPSYKYLRLPLEELEVQNGILTPTQIGNIEAEYIALLSPNFAGPLEPNGLVDESGNFFTNITVFPQVQERQIRRRRRRSTNGGLGGI